MYIIISFLQKTIFLRYNDIISLLFLNKIIISQSNLFNLFFVNGQKRT